MLRFTFSFLPNYIDNRYRRELAHKPTPTSQSEILPFVAFPPQQFAGGLQLSVPAGEELLFVLEGQVEITFPERAELLMVGDAGYFNALVPHRLYSVGNTPVSVLVVIRAEQESG